MPRLVQRFILLADDVTRHVVKMRRTPLVSSRDEYRVIVSHTFNLATTAAAR